MLAYPYSAGPDTFLRSRRTGRLDAARARARGCCSGFGIEAERSVGREYERGLYSGT